MKKLILIALSLVTMNSFAVNMENVMCEYTEPYVKAKVDIESMTLIIYEVGAKRPKLELITSIDIVNGVITYSSSNSSIKVDSTKEGNNGMSDDMMDYDSLLTTKGYSVYGGCNK